MLVKYPVEFPTEAIAVVTQAITTKSIDKKTFPEALWNIQGFAFSKAFGESSGFGSSAEPLTDEQAVEVLNSANNGEGFSSINWMSVLKWTLSLGIKLLL